MAAPEGSAAVSLITCEERLGCAEDGLAALPAPPRGERAVDFLGPGKEGCPDVSPAFPPGGDTDEVVISVIRRARRLRRLAGGLATVPTRRTAPSRRSAWSRQDTATHRDHCPPGRHHLHPRSSSMLGLYKRSAASPQPSARLRADGFHKNPPNRTVTPLGLEFSRQADQITPPKRRKPEGFLVPDAQDVLQLAVGGELAEHTDLVENRDRHPGVPLHVL